MRAPPTGPGIPLFAADIPRLKAFDKAFHARLSVGDGKAGPNAARAWNPCQEAGKEITLARTRQVLTGAPRAHAKPQGERAATRRRAVRFRHRSRRSDPA